MKTDKISVIMELNSLRTSLSDWKIYYGITAKLILFVVCLLYLNVGIIGVPCNAGGYCIEAETRGEYSNCTAFWQCIHGVWNLRPCPHGTAYNIYTMNCTYRSIGTCEGPCPSTEAYTGTTVTVPPGTCDDSIDELCKNGHIIVGGKFPDRSNCSTYHVCVSQLEGLQWLSCGIGTVFNVDKGECLSFSHDIDCSYEGRCPPTVTQRSSTAAQSIATSTQDITISVTNATYISPVTTTYMNSRSIIMTVLSEITTLSPETERQSTVTDTSENSEHSTGSSSDKEETTTGITQGSSTGAATTPTVSQGESGKSTPIMEQSSLSDKSTTDGGTSEQTTNKSEPETTGQTQGSSSESTNGSTSEQSQTSPLPFSTISGTGLTQQSSPGSTTATTPTISLEASSKSTPVAEQSSDKSTTNGSTSEQNHATNKSEPETKTTPLPFSTTSDTGAVIAGGVIGSVILVSLILVVILNVAYTLSMRRKRQRHTANSSSKELAKRYQPADAYRGEQGEDNVLEIEKGQGDPQSTF